MEIQIVTPAPRKTTRGNRVTAERWAGLLKSLGHRVAVAEKYEGEEVDLLIALHARRSYQSIRRFRLLHPQRPIVLALTGTDLYRDIQTEARARQSLKMADKIIALQPAALRELNRLERKKSQVIYQSVAPLQSVKKPRPASAFQICVAGHLRAVKDPFRAAMAVRRLPKDSRIRVILIGEALSPAMAERARHEMEINRRFRWLGELSHARAMRILAQSRLCVISSRMEGGANVMSEAIVARIPVLASRISGNTGILGEDYPGLFRAGATDELRQLILRAESDPQFLERLKRRIARLASRFEPARERRAWARVIDELRACHSKA